MKKKIVLLPLLTLTLAGCGVDPEPKPTPEIKVESVSLNETTKELLIGDTFSLLATVLPENASNKSVVWSSDNNNVITVDNGFVTAIGEGNANVTVKTVDQEKTAICNFTVSSEQYIHVESISLSETDVSLLVNETITISATILPQDAKDKSIRWESEDTSVATVSSGTITAVAEGDTLINAITNDGNKKASVSVSVSSLPPVPPGPVEDTETASLSANKYSNVDIQPLPKIDVKSASFTFSKGDEAYEPGYFTSKGGSFRLYAKGTLVISSSKGNIKSIAITYNAEKDTASLPLVADVGTLSSDYKTWTGNNKSVAFTANGDTGSKAFYTIDVTYVTNPQHDPIDLGVKSVKEVKDYINNAVANGDLVPNKYGMAADKLTTVTIKGYAIAKLNTVKTAAAYEYNITEPNKVVIGDDTDAIGVASKTGDGTLFKKVDNYQMKDTSRYSVTGYISVALGVPELICTSYEWDKTLDVKLDLDKISKGELTIPQFVSEAKNLNYNISGYAYGETYTLKGLTCYYVETDGQGKTYYNFTDGTNNIRVNAYNIDRVSEGFAYDITGVISMAKYSPIIVAYRIAKSSVSPVDLTHFFEGASEKNIQQLKTINYVNDTETKYPEVIETYSKIYKTTGYITTVEEGGCYYLSICDTFVNTKEFPNGKGASSIKYNLALIKNDNFWNIDDPYGRFNPYADVTDVDTKVTVYYTARQTEFYSKKMYWEVLLIPQSIPTL